MNIFEQITTFLGWANPGEHNTNYPSIKRKSVLFPLKRLQTSGGMGYRCPGCVAFNGEEYEEF